MLLNYTMKNYIVPNAWILLDELEFPQLTEDSKKKKLENSLSVEELLEAVQCMNSGKAPGPDGIPVEML